MTRDQIIDFLWAQWANVVVFFNGIFPLAVSILPNFYAILATWGQQVHDVSLRDAIAYANAILTSSRAYTDQVQVATIQIIMALEKVVTDLISLQLLNLTTSLHNVYDELNARLNMTNAYIDASMMVMRYYILDTLNTQVFPQINALIAKATSFDSLINTLGLGIPENIGFLKLFVSKPYVYIQEMIYESIFEIILYLLAKGLTREDRNIDDPPEISKSKPTSEMEFDYHNN